MRIVSKGIVEICKYRCEILWVSFWMCEFVYVTNMYTHIHNVDIIIEEIQIERDDKAAKVNRKYMRDAEKYREKHAIVRLVFEVQHVVDALLLHFLIRISLSFFVCLLYSLSHTQTLSFQLPHSFSLSITVWKTCLLIDE